MPLTAQTYRTLREGPRYQATIPAYVAQQPKYVEDQDKRRGRRTEPMDVMAAAPIEKMRADQLPFDAVSDPEFHRSDGGHPLSISQLSLRLVSCQSWHDLQSRLVIGLMLSASSYDRVGVAVGIPPKVWWHMLPVSLRRRSQSLLCTRTQQMCATTWGGRQRNLCISMFCERLQTLLT